MQLPNLCFDCPNAAGCVASGECQNTGAVVSFITHDPIAIVNSDVTLTGNVKYVAPDAVDHPPHYGGVNDPFEAIKVIDAWGLSFCLGNAIKYIKRAGKKPNDVADIDLKKALWYLNHELERLGHTNQYPWKPPADGRE